MRIIALDPSYTCTGLAVIVDGEPVAWDSLSFKRGNKKPSRAEKRAILKSWLQCYLSDCNLVVIEELWSTPGVSISTAIIDLAYSLGIAVHVINNHTWKFRIIGNGNASKSDSMVKASLITGKSIEDDNISDAICIGVVAAMHPDTLKQAE